MYNINEKLYRHQEQQNRSGINSLNKNINVLNDD